MEGNGEDECNGGKESSAPLSESASCQGADSTTAEHNGKDSNGKDSNGKEGTSTATNEEETASDAECRSQEATFPQQLMDMIEKETTSGNTTPNDEKVLEWLPNGDAFIIRDKSLLEKEVLPKYFNAKCKFMSFVRKLYRWGFRQVEKNVPGVTIFMHVNFVRGDKKRCLLMRSIVKNAASASTVRAPMSLLGQNSFGLTGDGAVMNQNLLAGLTRSFMGGLPGQIPQLNPLLFPQAAGSMNMQNILAMHQQQSGNQFPGLLNSGTLMPNSFSLPNASISSPSALASNAGFPSVQQQFSIANFLNYSNNGNQSNASTHPQAALPSNMTINVPSNSGTQNANISNDAKTAQGDHVVSTEASSNSSPRDNDVSALPHSAPNNAAAANTSNGATITNNLLTGSDSTNPVVILAMQIMQNNPSLEPRMALELAKNIRGET